MSQLAVKLGYPDFLPFTFHSQNTHLGTPRIGGRSYRSFVVFKLSQVFEFIDHCFLSSRLIDVLIRAYKCSKRQANVGIGGGKVGVRPRGNSLTFVSAFLRRLTIIISKINQIETSIVVRSGGVSCGISARSGRGCVINYGTN